VWSDLIIVLGGAAAILALAEIVLRATLRLAAHYGLSGTFVGLTVLSIGTSLMEIVTHIVGSVHILWRPHLMQDMSALLLGSNIGSDIFQQNVVLAVVALLGSVVVTHGKLAREVGALIAASAALWLACLGGVISRLEGVLLAFAYLGYLYYLWRQEPNERPVARHRRLTAAGVSWAGTVIVAGFAAMAMIADPVLVAATSLVQRLPMSASLFGVVVLGICTAMPELLTALAAIFKGQRDISAGILIGSNITNPLLGAGLGAAVSTYAVPPVIVVYDLPVKIASGALLYLLLWRRPHMGRHSAVALILVYLGYLACRQLFFPSDR
jgi:cation:H+ antiporter